MWAINVVQDYDTGRFTMMNIYDEESGNVCEANADYIRRSLKANPKAFRNVELDKYGKIRLVNMNPKVKVKHYATDYYQYYNGGYEVECEEKSYIIITRAQMNGLIDVIIGDNVGGVTVGKDMTLGDLASKLQMSIKDLKFYNGYINMEAGRPVLYVYRGNGEYRRLSANYTFNSSYIMLGDDWEGKVISATSNDLAISGLKHTKGVAKATIPSGIVELESYIGGVNVLTLPDSVMELGVYCFDGTQDLMGIKLSRSLTSIPERCFSDSALRQIKFYSKLRTIGREAFMDCLNLRCPIVCSVRAIGVRAFDSTGIAIVSLMDTEVIAKEAFAHNKRLSKVKLGDKLKTIGPCAFKDCPKLETIVFSDCLEEIGKDAFKNCKSLKKVYIPSSTKVHATAFPSHTEVIRK